MQWNQEISAGTSLLHFAVEGRHWKAARAILDVYAKRGIKNPVCSAVLMFRALSAFAAL